MNSEWWHREHNVTSLVLDVNGLNVRMAHSLRKTPTCEGEAGVSVLAETYVVPATYCGKPMESSAPRLR